MTQDSSADHRFLWLFLLVAFGWTWAFWLPLALHANAVIALPERLYRRFADGSPAAWGPLIGAVLSGAAVPASEALRYPASIPLAFVRMFFLGGPLQEEAGWRGVLTEAAQMRVGALGASLVARAIWGLWHLPLFFMPREDVYYNQPIWGLMVSTMLLSVLLTWVYTNTRRSLFAAMLMHTSWNEANFLFTGLQTDTGGAAFLALLTATVVVVVVVFGARDLVRRPG